MRSSKTSAYISIGSNLGDRAGNLLLALRGLAEASMEIERISPIYETEPIGIDTHLKFLNMAVEVSVENVTPTQMMARLLRIEYLLGRGDKSVKRSRTVDLDILFFGDLKMNTEFLTLPHPRLHQRKFVLCPLADIAATFVHPAFGMDIVDLLTRVDDQSCVKRWDPNQALPGYLAATS